MVGLQRPAACTTREVWYFQSLSKANSKLFQLVKKEKRRIAMAADEGEEIKDSEDPATGKIIPERHARALIT